MQRFGVLWRALGAFLLTVPLQVRVSAQCEIWEPLGNGIIHKDANIVWASTPFNGDLIVGGAFSAAGGVNASNIARWNESNWQPLGNGLNDYVRALAVYNGDLIAGGNPGFLLARWNGSVWQPFNGLSGPPCCQGIFALQVYDNDLIAAGYFNTANGQPAANIARWDGANWHPLGAGLTGGYAIALTVFDGELIAAGDFDFAGGNAASNIARWDGFSWQPLAGGLNGVVWALTVYNNELIAGGEFTQADGQNAFHVARWNGQAWQPLLHMRGPGNGVADTAYCLSVYQDLLIVGGRFMSAAGQIVPNTNKIASWDGSIWQSVDGGVNTIDQNEAVDDLSVYNDFLVAAGRFDNMGGVSANSIATWGFRDHHWSAGGSGTFHNASHWSCGIVPTSSLHAIFDGTVFPMPASVGVTFLTAGAANRRLLVNTESVSFSLIGHDYQLTADPETEPPSLVVGVYPAEDTRLAFGNNFATLSTVTTGSISIADAPASIGRLTLDSLASGQTVDLDAVGDVFIGREGDGMLIVQNQSEFRYDNPQPFAIDFIVGDSGDGHVTLKTGGQILSQNEINDLAFARAPGSSADVLIEDANVIWSNMSHRLLIGESGDAQMQIMDGAEFLTITTDELVLAQNPGSSADILISGDGSRWAEFIQPITMGDGDVTITVEDGGALEAFLINNFQNGTIAGDGVIVAADLLFNLGAIAPSGSQTSVGTLTIDGNYRQVGPSPQGGSDESGKLFIDISSNGGVPVADRLHVTGAAELGGGLFVDVDAGLELDDATQLTILTASRIPASHGTMDVAFLPALSDNTKFMKVNYPGSALAGSDAVTLSIDDLDSLLDFTSNNESVNGAPTAAAVGDFNGDLFDDLVVTVNDDGGPDFAYVLLNNQAGAFDAPVQYTVGTHPSAIVTGEFDLKPGIDLAIANLGDGTVQLLGNSGSGTFTDIGEPIVVGPQPVAMAAASINGAGGDDLALAFVGSNIIKVVFFPFPPGQLPVSLTTGDEPIAIEPCDVENDRVISFADLAVLNRGSNSVSIFKNNGNSTFTTLPAIAVGQRPIDMVVSDLNGDLFPEIVTANRPLPGDGVGSISVVLNTSGNPFRGGSSASFAPAVTIDTELPPQAIVGANLDSISDDDVDLAVLLDDGAQAKVQALRNDTDVIASPSTIVLAPVIDPPAQTVAAGALTMVIADLNDDTQSVLDDVIVINQSAPSPLAGGVEASNISALFNATKPIGNAVPCPPDIAPTGGGNGVVDVDDLLTVINSWGVCIGCAADIAPPGGNGAVNVDDLLEIINNWGPCL